ALRFAEAFELFVREARPEVAAVAGHADGRRVRTARPRDAAAHLPSRHAKALQTVVTVRAAAVAGLPGRAATARAAPGVAAASRVRRSAGAARPAGSAAGRSRASPRPVAAARRTAAPPAVVVVPI